jgi:hypothetical protein
MLVLLRERNYEVIVEMGSCGMIFVPSFMKIGPGIQEILRVVLSNWKGSNVGITDRKDI